MRCGCKGASGEVVDVIAYRDKMQQDRKVYRLTVHGVFIGEFKTPAELGKHVDLGRSSRTLPAALTSPLRARTGTAGHDRT